MRITRKFVTVTLAFCLLLTNQTSFAAPIPVGLDITGTMETTQVDPFATLLADGNVHEGGATTGPIDISGLGSVNGTFTATDDGFDMGATATGNGGDGIAYGIFGNDFLIDVAIAMTNNTADTLRLTWSLSWGMSVDADGDDAFAEASMSFDDGLSTLIASNVISDTVFGDAKNQNDLGTLGANITDFGATIFVFDLTAGASADLNGLFGLRGGTYTTVGDFAALGDFNLRLRSVENLTPPVQTPEPLTILLIGCGLLGIALYRRKA
ncbi:PEP-CTERM sorting domain-containing protein [Aestuariibacter halophilus]|uniref:PEP-CTERM sorting domain-containing protein n=1 Tax=Fluctibacter halophilus TaxID=226011 RepID=A0ABS8G6Z1_9ALTE|nr:PEP-CTERM sorting domain-containing protein [Aestuariibacter halophilus]MCC2615866.1 PEP-CTERM sorting domain-containing protein [Aestuariibacter halophilus]